MFYGETIQDTRQLFFSSWDKHCHQKPMSPLEQQIAQVIRDHPEYHSLLQHPGQFQTQSYYPELGETNPFLHMGLHLAIRDQVATNRPEGILARFNRLVKKYQDPLAVEHLMMERLAECLWVAQRDNTAPNDQNYLRALAEL